LQKRLIKVLESKDFDPVEASLQRLENKAKKLYGV
jgi:hypothetical protein